MSREGIIDLLYRGTTTIQEFQWDMLTTVPILTLVSTEDIAYLRKLITSPRYSGNSKLKLEKMDELMHYRGFTKFAGGTNRIVYTHPSAPNAVFKVAVDIVGINDNPAEYRNQQFLKPYCCKVFECSPCGTIASFERVRRITTVKEFCSIASDYYYLITRCIIGKYVMEDIGINYFMNIGIRDGFGIVLLDFPYLFELDGAKLRCPSLLEDNSICGGEIDYDSGFNKLICTKCQREYRARDLGKPPQNGGIIVHKEGTKPMSAYIILNGKIVKSVSTGVEREYLSANDKNIGRKQFNDKKPYNPQAFNNTNKPIKSYSKPNDERQPIIFTDKLPKFEDIPIGQIYCIKTVDNLYTQKVVDLEIYSLRGLDLDMFDAYIRIKDQLHKYKRDPETKYLSSEPIAIPTTEEETSNDSSEEDELALLAGLAKSNKASLNIQ